MQGNALTYKILTRTKWIQLADWRQKPSHQHIRGTLDTLGWDAGGLEYLDMPKNRCKNIKCTIKKKQGYIDCTMRTMLKSTEAIEQAFLSALLHSVANLKSCSPWTYFFHRLLLICLTHLEECHPSHSILKDKGSYASCVRICSSPEHVSMNEMWKQYAHTLSKEVTMEHKLTTMMAFLECRGKQ